MFRTTWRLAVALSVALSLTAAAPVSAATYRSTSVREVWGSMGVWGTYATFWGDWTYQSNSNGTSTVSDVQMEAGLRYGDDCSQLVCEDWAYGFTATFLSSAGSVLKTIHPSGPVCHASAWPGRDRVFLECRGGSFNLPASASKVKFEWSVSVQRSNGFWSTPWRASKTVSIG